MPNHVTNILKVKEGEYDLSTVTSFNQVLPVPKVLEEEPSDGITVMVEQALSVRPTYGGKKPELEDIRKEYENDSKILERIDRIVDNIKEYGSGSWYEWCWKRWGTKWDMYGRVYEEDSNTLFFDTAWSHPYGWFKEFSKQLPDGVVLELTYADEDYGSNAGRIIASNSSYDGYYPEALSSDCIAFAVEIHGKEPFVELVNGEWQFIDYEEGEEDE